MRLNPTDNKEKYKKQKFVALQGSILEFINLILEFVNAFFSQSIIVWADTFASFEATSHQFIVLVAASKMEKETGNKYNFGLERFEAVISFICDLFVAIGYLVITISAVYQIFHITPPETAIFYFLLLKIINILADIYFYIQQYLVQKKHPSLLNETEIAKSTDNLVDDIITGIIVSVCWFFRDNQWSWYIAPICTIALSLVFSWQCMKRVRDSFSELTDISASVEDQDKIFDMMLNYSSSFKKLNEINCRFLNHRLYVELDVIFKPDTTYEEQVSLLKEISKDVNDFFYNSVVSIKIENKVLTIS